jgi:hypothetical protein
MRTKQNSPLHPPAPHHFLSSNINLSRIMNRRYFLSLSGLAGGSCLIPGTIARRIHEVCIGASQPLVLAPDRFSLELYATKSYGGYMLHLGNPEDALEYPTLREFIERRSYIPDDDRSLLQYLIEWRSYDGNEGDEIKDTIKSLKSELDDPIDNSERHWWDDWDGPLTEGTLPQAHHYLSELPLDDDESPSGFSLGQLSFIESDRPGFDLTYVEADSLAAIAGLQHRLNELQTGARIVMA